MTAGPGGSKSAAMKFTIRHPYAIEPEAFWREVFFDHAYNEKLYREGLLPREALLGPEAGAA